MIIHPWVGFRSMPGREWKKSVPCKKGEKNHKGCDNIETPFKPFPRHSHSWSICEAFCPVPHLPRGRVDSSLLGVNLTIQAVLRQLLLP